MNMKFGKLNLTGGVEYAPNPAVIITHHHDEWDEPVDGEEGVTEHKSSDWDERKTIVNPTADQYLRADGGPFLPIENTPHAPPEGEYAVKSHYEERDGKIVTVWEYAPIPVTEADYDAAMEEHIRKAREERGYTTREPSEYISSSVPRWAQDAADFVRFRDEVMVYGLTILNEWKATGVEPSYDEFIANLPKIKWAEA